MSNRRSVETLINGTDYRIHYRVYGEAEVSEIDVFLVEVWMVPPGETEERWGSFTLRGFDDELRELVMNAVNKKERLKVVPHEEP